MLNKDQSQKLVKTLELFTNIAAELEVMWEESSVDDVDMMAKDYPFEKSFDELVLDIYIWNFAVRKIMAKRLAKDGDLESYITLENGTVRERRFLEMSNFIGARKAGMAAEIEIERNGDGNELIGDVLAEMEAE